MGILNFPPEVLLLVLELALPQPPFSFCSSPLHDRSSFLRRYSLVHPTWRRLSQSLLPRYLVFNKKRDWKRTVDALNSVAPFAQARIFDITFDPGPSPNDIVPNLYSSRLSGVRSVKVARTLDLMLLKPFTGLEELTVSQVVGATEQKIKQLHFGDLRRLAIRGERSRELSTYCYFLDQAILPNLQHLSISSNGKGQPLQTTSTAVLPSLKSLAIDHSRPIDQRLFQIFVNNDHLEHLSLTLSIPDMQTCLFGGIAKVKLKSLHVGAYHLVKESKPGRTRGARGFCGQRWLDLAKGDNEDIQAERVVLYGRRCEASKLIIPEEDIGRFDWLSGRETPPHEDFDGSV